MVNFLIQPLGLQLGDAALMVFINATILVSQLVAMIVYILGTCLTCPPKFGGHCTKNQAVSTPCRLAFLADYAALLGLLDVFR
jgi:hypothetical protein